MKKDGTSGIKVKIGDTIYDSNEVPIMIIFEDDNQRKLVASQISNMPDREAVRKYVQYPDGSKKDDILNFMKL
jgi:hypothetical protein